MDFLKRFMIKFTWMFNWTGYENKKQNDKVSFRKIPEKKGGQNA